MEGRMLAPVIPTLPAPPLTTPLPAQEIRLTPCGHRPAPCNPLGHRRIQQGDGVYDSEIRPNTFSEFRLKRLPPPRRRRFLFLTLFPPVFFALLYRCLLKFSLPLLLAASQPSLCVSPLGCATVAAAGLLHSRLAL